MQDGELDGGSGNNNDQHSRPASSSRKRKERAVYTTQLKKKQKQHPTGRRHIYLLLTVKLKKATRALVCVDEYKTRLWKYKHAFHVTYNNSSPLLFSFSRFGSVDYREFSWSGSVARWASDGVELGISASVRRRSSARWRR
jgi:hypothetical protein